MYFANRAAAGKLLADQLVEKYRYEDCAVVALSDGGVIVGSQIAAYLHCILTMVLFEGIHLPSEPEAIAGINHMGDFSYSSKYSAGDITEYTGEFRNHIDAQKVKKLQEMNRLIAGNGPIQRQQIYGHNIILVSDGLKDGFALDMIEEFLKPIKINKLIVAAPMATVSTVDRVHVLADEVHILSVRENIDLGVDHYYDNPELPSHEQIIKIIQDIVLNWK